MEFIAKVHHRLQQGPCIFNLGACTVAQQWEGYGGGSAGLNSQRHLPSWLPQLQLRLQLLHSN